MFFIKGICQFPTSVGVPPGSAHFRALDLDHDGLVSRSEFARGAGAAGELAAGDEAIVVQVQGAEVGGTWWNTNRCWELTDTFNKKQGKDRNDMCSLIFGDVMWGTSAKYQQIGQKND